MSQPHQLTDHCELVAAQMHSLAFELRDQWLTYHDQPTHSMYYLHLLTDFCHDWNIWIHQHTIWHDSVLLLLLWLYLKALWVEVCVFWHVCSLSARCMNKHSSKSIFVILFGLLCEKYYLFGCMERKVYAAIVDIWRYTLFCLYVLI